MPGRFLLQVLRSLVTHGVLSSHRGIDGGYVLARPADQITLFDIVEVFDNSLDTHIPGVEFLLPQVRAKILAALREASAAERDELRKLTIADLLLAAEEIQAANVEDCAIREYDNPPLISDFGLFSMPICLNPLAEVC